MIIGDTQRFAIESTIEEAFYERSILFNGYLFIHLNGRRYGSGYLSAASGFCGEVEESLRWRGRHTLSMSRRCTSQRIAELVYSAVYRDEHQFRGLAEERSSVRSEHYENKLSLAASDIEAWDDGTFVLQIDEDDSVRVIAFMSCDEDAGQLIDCVEERRLSAAEYYGVLEAWRDACEEEWRASKKRGLE
jgi:hypothetical protein